MFEVACAAHFLEHAFVTSVRLKPKYLVGQSIKMPDFEIAVVGERAPVVCECKSANEAARKYRQQLSRILELASGAIEARGGIPDDARLEIHIAGRRRTPAEILADQIAAWACRASFDETAKFGEVSLCLQRKGTQLTFEERDYVEAQFKISTEPRAIRLREAEIVLTVADLSAKRARALGRLVREAKGQLPTDRSCLIFLETATADMDPGIQASERRLATGDYLNIRGVIIAGSPEAKVVHRTGDELIRKLFPNVPDRPPVISADPG
ncbi:MAG: hypothetical protein ACE5IZ_11335 [Dehalococcoidia bacterium]